MTPSDSTKISLPSRGPRTTTTDSMCRLSKVDAVEVTVEAEERAVADTVEEVVENDEAEAVAETKTVNASSVAMLRIDITPLQSTVT